MRGPRRAVNGLLALLALPLGADEVHLKGGGKLEGVVVERTARMLILETGPGRVGVALARVERVVSGHSSLAEHQRRAARLADGDVAGWLDLAEWAREAGLQTQAREAFEHVRRLEPDNAAAQTALGNVAWGGRWMSLDEARRAQGLVSFEGEWLTPDERDARLRARADDAALAQARAESAARVREAEARAAAAEADARRAESEARAAESGSGVPLWIGGSGFGLECASGCCGPACDGREPPQTGTQAPPRATPRETPRPRVDSDAEGGARTRPQPRAATPGGPSPGTRRAPPPRGAHDDDDGR